MAGLPENVLVLEDERQKRAARWHEAALVVGYNELARMTKRFGEKVYFRLARDVAEKKYLEMGGERFLEREDVVTTLKFSEAMPAIEFKEEDLVQIEPLVRERIRREAFEEAAAACAAVRNISSCWSGADSCVSKIEELARR